MRAFVRCAALRIVTVVTGVTAVTRVTVVTVFAFATLAVAVTGPVARGRELPSREPQAAAADRAVAYGLLLDSPRSEKVVAAGIVVADKLCRRYGIDTGDVLADRRAAAERAQVELLDTLTFTEAQVKKAARWLGYSLDPTRCRNTCTHVRALAVIELQKRALAAFADDQADGRATDGTVVVKPPAGQRTSSPPLTVVP